MKWPEESFTWQALCSQKTPGWTRISWQTHYGFPFCRFEIFRACGWLEYKRVFNFNNVFKRTTGHAGNSWPLLRRVQCQVEEEIASRIDCVWYGWGCLSGISVWKWSGRAQSVFLLLCVILPPASCWKVPASSKQGGVSPKQWAGVTSRCVLLSRGSCPSGTFRAAHLHSEMGEKCVDNISLRTNADTPAW